jgi:hypothetical protein
MWGGAGNTPGQSDGAWYRSDHVKLHENVPNLDDPDQNPLETLRASVPTLFAAYVNSSDQALACAGRAAQYTGDMPTSVPARFDLKLKNLTRDQIEELAEKSENLATYRWPRPNGNLYTNDASHSTVWGESCIGKRHFDCIGFVNWCLSTTLQKHVQYGIPNFTGDPVKGVKASFRRSRFHRCGLAISLPSAWNTSASFRIANSDQAKDSANGVVESGFGLAVGNNASSRENMWNFGAEHKQEELAGALRPTRGS